METMRVGGLGKGDAKQEKWVYHVVGRKGWAEEWQKEWQHRTCRIKGKKSLKDAAYNSVRVGRDADN